jgi:hypothetical protein
VSPRSKVSLTYATPVNPRTEVMISGQWGSGAYVDLFFGDARTPTEVVNVYDYRTGENELVTMLKQARAVFGIPDSDPREARFNELILPVAVEAVIVGWIADQDEEELAYRVADYDDKADRDEIRAQWASGPERAWLAAYIANSR